MLQNRPRSAELVMPAASLAALRRSLVEQLGPEPAARALQRAGHIAGEAFYNLLIGRGDTSADAVGETGVDSFWQRLNELLSARGWGRLTHERVHAGIGSLRSADWAEADVNEFAGRPSCFFTTGLLAHLLGQTAGREVGVFEAECRSNGDAECRFLFGGPAALRGIYDAMSSGEDVTAALASLG
jgi:predicted hydrocarbon binding protein